MEGNPLSVSFTCLGVFLCWKYFSSRIFLRFLGLILFSWGLFFFFETVRIFDEEELED